MSLGRTERILLYLTGGLVAAVVVAVAATPRPLVRQAPAAALDSAESSGGEATEAATTQQGAARDFSPTRSASAEPATPLDTAALRARFLSSAPGTYLFAMAKDDGGWLYRWPDRHMEALRVWVDPSSALPGWDPAYAQVARDAFDDWGSSGSPLHFMYTVDSASADVHVVWVDHFPPSDAQAIGVTDRDDDDHGWVKSASVRVALHGEHGNTFTPDEVAGIIRHEVGHALGLGHSPDTASVMFPFAGVTAIASVDRVTLHALYTLPPGHIGTFVPDAAP